jgi:hypothetical protein
MSSHMVEVRLLQVVSGDCCTALPSAYTRVINIPIVNSFHTAAVGNFCTLALLLACSNRYRLTGSGP